MKLIDLTKKKLVHKASVAAGKAPRLELGVLGISIGQQQSTGDTSKPAMKWMNRSLNESIQLTADDLIEVLEYLGIRMARERVKEYQGDPLPIGFDIDATVREALLLYSHAGKSQQHAESVEHFNNMMWHLNILQTNKIEELDKLEEKITDEGHGEIISDIVKRMHENLRKLHVDLDTLKVHKEMLSRIQRQINYIMLAANGKPIHNREMEHSQVKIAQAFFKMHGVPLRDPDE